jgi:hypothetical protein
MATVYGDVRAEDEHLHPLGPEKNFNESMYFNFFDRGRGHGGFVRVGNRANEGYAEVTVCVYLPAGEVLFNYLRPSIATNDAFDAGGMRFDVVTPLVAHRTRYEGGAVFLREPTEMADPRHAFTSNPHRRLAIDLAHEAVGPVYGSRGADEGAVDPEREFARGHYEQHMRVTGEVRIDDAVLPVEAFGLRDHSWGPRSWQALAYYRWLNCTFGPDLGIMLSEIQPQEGPLQQGGVVVHGDSLERIASFTLASELVEGTPYHRALRATCALANGATLDVAGRVLGFVPLRNRRAGRVTHIGEGMTEYRCEGHVGVGISEYLDQVA